MGFDARIDRIGSGSLKWDNPKNGEGLAPIIPLWVADMDFSPPPAVLEAIRRRAGHPVYGYGLDSPRYAEALSAWHSRRHGVSIRPGAFIGIPAVMPGISMAIRELTGPGEGVLVMAPVYAPFYDVVRYNNRELLLAPLEWDGQGYKMDFAAMARTVDEAQSRGIKASAALLCNPHNPGGRVWRKEELSALAAFAQERGLYLIADEIHSDIVYARGSFTSLAGFSPGFGRERLAERVVVVSGPNKTFNLAGLHIGHMIAEDCALAARLRRAVMANGYHEPNVFSAAAAQAAYESGEQWLDSLLPYLRGNLEFLKEFCDTRLPGASLSLPEGTYLGWMDCSGLMRRLGLGSGKELSRLWEDEARVRVSEGSFFGPGGDAFERVNVACPRSVLAEGLERIAAWTEKRD